MPALKPTKSGCRYYGRHKECWVQWWRFDGQLTNKEVNEFLEKNRFRGNVQSSVYYKGRRTIIKQICE